MLCIDHTLLWAGMLHGPGKWHAPYDNANVLTHHKLLQGEGEKLSFQDAGWRAGWLAG